MTKHQSASSKKSSAHGEANNDKKQANHTPQLIDGKMCAEKLRNKVAHKVAWVKEKHNLTPGLAVILVGENPASEVYVRNKVKHTEEVGMNSFKFTMPANTSEQQLINKIEHLNNDPKVHGILVQLPLPDHINETAIIDAIEPDKDVDGFHVANMGGLVTGFNTLVPCTPQGCLLLIKTVTTNLAGKHAVIIGRSNIVGKPMAHLLLKEDCTVTITHSKTKDLPEVCSRANIIVAAVGIPQLVKAFWVRKGAIVIDVGINRIDTEDGKTKLVGDVDFDEVFPKVRAITPVPGGVGPMTIACLLKNTLQAACDQRDIPMPRSSQISS